MKRKQLTMAQLGTLSLGLMKNLFPSPSQTDLLVEEDSTATGDGFFIYFSEDYFIKLTSKMLEQYSNGSYAKSNAEQDWISLMMAIKSAEAVININKNNLKPHFLTK
jgi:hypothetical protein